MDIIFFKHKFKLQTNGIKHDIKIILFNALRRGYKNNKI
jgi:hypothetical protein